MRYTLLLRGINVGGKNKVAMADLKADLAGLGFENPISYINSGNLFFDSQEHEKKIRTILTAYFSQSYDFPIPFVLLNSAILQEEVAKLPAWWQDEAAYRRDVLFFLPEANREQIEVEAGSWANDRELCISVRQPSFTEIATRLTISSPTTTRSYSNLTFTSL